MNGFIIFEDRESIARFLASSEILALDLRRLSEMPRDAVLLFRDLGDAEFDVVCDVAERLGGRVRAAERYEPLD